MADHDPRAVLIQKITKIVGYFAPENRKEDGTITLTVFQYHFIMRALVEILKYVRESKL